MWILSLYRLNLPAIMMLLLLSCFTSYCKAWGDLLKEVDTSFKRLINEPLSESTIKRLGGDQAIVDLVSRERLTSEKVKGLEAFKESMKRSHICSSGFAQKPLTSDSGDTVHSIYKWNKYEGTRVDIYAIASGNQSDIPNYLMDEKEGIVCFLSKLFRRGYQLTDPRVLKNAFIAYNDGLKATEVIDIDSGNNASLLVVIDTVKSDNIVLANVGDTEAVVIKRDSSVLTLPTHELGNPAELARIQSIYKECQSSSGYDVASGDEGKDYHPELAHGLGTLTRVFGNRFIDAFSPVPWVCEIPKSDIALLVVAARIGYKEIMKIATSGNANLKEHKEFSREKATEAIFIKFPDSDGKPKI